MLNRLMLLALTLVLGIGLTACEAEEEKEAKLERQRLNARNNWYLCVHKEDETGEIVQMTEYDKYKIIKSNCTNYRILAVDGLIGNEGQWKTGSMFVLISQDTIVKDIDNTIIGTEIKVIKDDGSCNCHSYSE